jgi:fermentation-respiration switch protein FrsA (DUF1100 family)
VVATFTSLRDVARVHYGLAGAAIGGRFDTMARLDHLHVPLLIAHGDQDEIVPFELGVKLFEAAGEPKKFLRVEGAHHNDVFASDELMDAIVRFANEVATDTPPAPRTPSA